MIKIGAVICLYDDDEYVEVVLDPILTHLHKILFIISDIPWNGKPSDNSSVIDHIERICKIDPYKIKLIRGRWSNEWDQRNYGLGILESEGIDYCLVLDNDEVYHEEHFKNILHFVDNNRRFNAFHIEWNTYWKKDYYRIEPRENFKPLIIVKTNGFHFTGIRMGTTEVMKHGSKKIISQSAMTTYNGIIIPPSIAICYHLSRQDEPWPGTDDFMKRKLETNSHSPEFIKGWYENVWEKWSPSMRNLHPVSPEQYSTAVPEDFVTFPRSLKSFIKKEKLSNRICSIIIPNWNSADLLRRCLELIKVNTRKPHEIIIIDNGSTKDDSIEYIKSTGMKYILNSQNRGFPAAINQGILKSNPNSDICLLNVDAEVQDGWLDEMYKTMTNISDCGMVGPLGNEVLSGHQREGYVSNDVRTPNLYGFCILIMRELINKIGLFDERYGRGGYEDNDYGIRAKLAGYELYICSRSLVKHKAHQVYELNGIDSHKDQVEMERMYLNKFFGVLLDLGKVYDFYSSTDLARKVGIKI